MEIFSLLQDLDITFHQWEKGVYNAHKHSFFELLYITEGEGDHYINQEKYSYKKGDLFLLIPGDEHYLKVAKNTAFIVLLFNKIYFNDQTRKLNKSIDFSFVFRQLEFILLNAKFINQPIFTDASEKSVIEFLFNHLHNEFGNKLAFHETIVQNSIVNVLCLITRKIRDEVLGDFRKKCMDSNITEVIFYIQDNIYNNEKIKIANLASTFNKSRNLFTAYFKSNTGYAVKEYILNYKQNLVKNMLLYSSLNVGEIAHTLGFTDENHLNKFVKKRLGTTASKYRQLNAKSS